MNKFKSVANPLIWSMALILSVFTAGCNNGSTPVLGGGGVGANAQPRPLPVTRLTE